MGQVIASECSRRLKCNSPAAFTSFQNTLEWTKLTHRLRLKVKQLVSDEFELVAMYEGEECPTEEFLYYGEGNTAAYRQGLVEMLKAVASFGLHGVPSAWLHEASKTDGVYEFIKGPLRLFFFKGHGAQIAVCCCGTRKHGAKADKASVRKAALMRAAYFEAVKANQIEVITYEDE